MTKWFSILCFSPMPLLASIHGVAVYSQKAIDEYKIPHAHPTSLQVGVYSIASFVTQQNEKTSCELGVLSQNGFFTQLDKKQFRFEHFSFSVSAFRINIIPRLTMTYVSLPCDVFKQQKRAVKLTYIEKNHQQYLLVPYKVVASFLPLAKGGKSSW